MKKEITSLTGKTKNIYFGQGTQITNRQTGEVVQFERGESLKIDKPLTKNKDFVMLFLENAPLLSSLSKVSRVLLDYIMKYMTRRNLWCNSRSFRSSLYGTTAKKRGKVVMSDNSYRVALDELKKAGVLIDINNAEAQDAFGFNDYDIDTFEGEHYLVNPNLIGNGSIEDLLELRQALEVRFYRDNDGYFNVEKNISVSAFYDGFEEVAEHPEKFEIINQDINKRNHRTTTIKEREPNVETIDAVEVSQEPQALPAPQSQAKSDKEIDLEILREQNRARELSIKEKELNLELKKLEVVEKSDLAKKIIDDNPLWFDQKRADVIDALGDRDRDENL